MIDFNFGRLKELRRRKRWKQDELGQLLSCSGSCISKWELGLNEITASELARVANVFGVKDMNEFFVQNVDENDGGFANE